MDWIKATPRTVVVAYYLAGAVLWSSGDEAARAWDVDVARLADGELAAFLHTHVPWRLGPDDRVDRRTIEDLEGAADGERRPDRE